MQPKLLLSPLHLRIFLVPHATIVTTLSTLTMAAIRMRSMAMLWRSSLGCISEGAMMRMR
eukprot:scaffold6436_cov76-Skeletonema_dohrnii-CCMP3373.AAC.1